eukprot:18792-Heterococcus_DN1.PRE.4
MGVPPRNSTHRAAASPQPHTDGNGSESRFTALQAQHRRQTAAGISSSSSTPSSPTAAAVGTAAAAAAAAGSSDTTAAAQDRPDKLEFDVLMSIVTMAAVAEGGAPLVMLVDSAQHMDEQYSAAAAVRDCTSSIVACPPRLDKCHVALSWCCYFDVAVLTATSCDLVKASLKYLSDRLLIVITSPPLPWTGGDSTAEAMRRMSRPPAAAADALMHPRSSSVVVSAIARVIKVATAADASADEDGDAEVRIHYCCCNQQSFDTIIAAAS